MKRKFFFLFSFFNINFCVCLFAQDYMKDTLYVESVDFHILTFHSVSCGNFATGFRDMIKFKTIVNKDTIAILDSFLNKIKYARKDRDVDVRAKFVYEKGNKDRVIVCTNGYEILINNRLVKRNGRLADFLRGLTLQK